MKALIWKDTCTPMFIAALFTIAETWKQLKCPSTDEWIKKIWWIYTWWNTTQPWKGGNFAICNNMDGLGRYYKWNARETQILYDTTYVASKKHSKVVNITKKQTCRYRELVITNEDGEERKGTIKSYNLLYKLSNKDILYNRGNTYSIL